VRSKSTDHVTAAFEIKNKAHTYVLLIWTPFTQREFHKRAKNDVGIGIVLISVVITTDLIGKQEIIQ
jgi:hypothetical protein